MISFALKVFATFCFVYAAYYAITAPRQLFATASWLLAMSVAALVVQWATGIIQAVALIAVVVCGLFLGIAAIAALRAIK